MPKIAYWGALSKGPTSAVSPHPHRWEKNEVYIVATHIRGLFVDITEDMLQSTRGFLDLDDYQLARLDAMLKETRTLSPEQRERRRHELTEASNFFALKR